MKNNPLNTTDKIIVAACYIILIAAVFFVRLEQ
jgi:hypothetical protein